MISTKWPMPGRMGAISMDFSCKNCKKRASGCHADCPVYIEEKERLDAEKKKTRKEKALSFLINTKALCEKSADEYNTQGGSTNDKTRVFKMGYGPADILPERSPAAK